MGRRKGYGIAVIAVLCMSIMLIWPISRYYAEAMFLRDKGGQVSNPAILSSIIILPEKEEDWNEAGEIVARISSLPECLLEKIKDNGIRLKIFTDQLTDQPEAAHLKGVLPRGYTTTTWDDVPGMGGGRTVLVKAGSSDMGMGHDSMNLELHELAHSIDSIILSYRSQSEEFKQIWREEVAHVFPGRDYFLDYPEEYFAETFTLYYYDEEMRSRLYTNAPKTFAFFEQLELTQFA